MCRIVTIASFAALSALPLAAQSNPSSKVDSLMATFFLERGPGAAVAVILDGRVVHQKSYGLADVERSLPIASATTFDIGSVSKQFTAMAIMMLAESGTLSYEDPLTKFFPNFATHGAKITVRHLLNHTSGLPDYRSLFERNPAGIGAEPSSQEIIALLARAGALRFVPGERYEYSNSGYVVLAQIVEKAAGLSFPQFLKSTVFEPLGMGSTIVSDQIMAPAVMRAISYEPANGTFRNADYSPLNRIYGGGNVNSSLDDMVKWAQVLYTERLVKHNALEEAFTPGTLNNGSSTTYGFGWLIGTINGRRVLSHGGAWAGFRAYIMRIPSERFRLIVLSNVATAVNPGAVGREIAIMYLGDRIPKLH